MSPFVPPYVSTELIADLDAQLMRLGCGACHVVAGPALVGIAWDAPAPVTLEHPELDTYLQAEMIAQRVNALQSTSDVERSRILKTIGRAAP
jgi:hypothetical protein